MDHRSTPPPLRESVGRARVERESQRGRVQRVDVKRRRLAGLARRNGGGEEIIAQRHEALPHPRWESDGDAAAEVIAVDHDICRVRGRTHAILRGEIVMERHHRPHARRVEGVEGGVRPAHGIQGDVRAQSRATDASVAQAEEAWLGGPKRAFAGDAVGGRIEREGQGFEVDEDGRVRRHRAMQAALVLGLVLGLCQRVP